MLRGLLVAVKYIYPNIADDVYAVIARIYKQLWTYVFPTAARDIAIWRSHQRSLSDARSLGGSESVPVTGCVFPPCIKRCVEIEF